MLYKKLVYGKATSTSSASSTQTSSASSSSSNTKEGGGSSESGGSGSSGGDSEGSQKGGSSSGSENSNEEKIEVTELVSKNILELDGTPNWDILKSKIENLYSIWSAVSIDLLDLNVSQDEINVFSKIMNEASLKIKEENKIESIEKLVDLYEKILTFYNSFDNQLNEEDIKVKTIKYNVVIAYENVEKEKWEDSKKYIQEAQKINQEIMYISKNPNEHIIKKINIILNQILTSLDTKDKNIFYINYRNLIEEIDLI